MYDPYARDDWFTVDTIYGNILVRLTRYYPGTNFTITSRSLEPNDEPEYEYEVYFPTNEDIDPEDWVFKLNHGLTDKEKDAFNLCFVRIYDDDNIYDEDKMNKRVEEYIKENG